MPGTEPHSASAVCESWLEVIDCDSPILLIAPHGGRAEPRTRSMLNPKVNDLHTADITRGLAARMGASALINVAMDRNRIDCNRLSQIIERAPWLLEKIAQRVDAIVARHGRVTVLLIHGWNIIEPRVDFGLGLRHSGGELRPPGSACVSASDDFINCQLAGLADRLHRHGIKPTYGMRYPGGGLQNLLQAFTARHCQSSNAPLRSISETATRGVVDAAQLELSVALRMPGELRARCEDAIAEVFAGNRADAHDPRAPIVVNRAPRPPVAKSEIGAAATVAAPGRVGVEFYDPAARIGAMASFDVGGAGMGARIMMLFDGHRAALFTAEGRPMRSSNAVTHGPLALRREDESIVLAFRGPAVIVPDAAAYLSIERALASGRLDGDAEVNLRFEIDRAGGEFDFDRILSAAGGAQDGAGSSASFGRMGGQILHRRQRAGGQRICARGNVVHRTGTAEVHRSPDALGVLRRWRGAARNRSARGRHGRRAANRKRQDSRRRRLVAVRAARAVDRDALGRGTAASDFRPIGGLRRIVARTRGQRRMLYSAVASGSRAVAHLHVARIRELPQWDSSRGRDV